MALAVSQHTDTARTPILGLCHNHIDTSKNTNAWAVSQHTDTGKNTNAWAVSQHIDAMCQNTLTPVRPSRLGLCHCTLTTARTPRLHYVMLCIAVTTISSLDNSAPWVTIPSPPPPPPPARKMEINIEDCVRYPVESNKQINNKTATTELSRTPSSLSRIHF